MCTEHRLHTRLYYICWKFKYYKFKHILLPTIYITFTQYTIDIFIYTRVWSLVLPRFGHSIKHLVNTLSTIELVVALIQLMVLHERMFKCSEAVCWS